MPFVMTADLSRYDTAIAMGDERRVNLLIAESHPGMSLPVRD